MKDRRFFPKGTLGRESGDGALGMASCKIDGVPVRLFERYNARSATSTRLSISREKPVVVTTPIEHPIMNSPLGITNG